MADKRQRLTLDSVPDNFDINYLQKEISLKKKQKAHGFLSGAYIKIIEIFAGNAESIQIRGEVHPSQRKNDACHVVNIEINTAQKTLLESHCKCQQGHNGCCSHVVAVIMAIEQMKVQGYKDVPALLTSTSLPQQWDKPRGDRILAEPVSQMVFARPNNLSRKRRPIMAKFVDERKISIEKEDLEALKRLKSSAISYLVEDNEETMTELIDTPFGQAPVGSALSYHGPLAEPICHPQEQCSNCGDFIYPKELASNVTTVLDGQQNVWREMNVSLDAVRDIEAGTRLQSASARWFEERKNRVTASNFGAIMTRKKAFNEAFMKNTFGNRSFQSKATSYGQVNEKNAKKIYVKKSNCHLHDVGLVVNPSFPFLGASPDAIVCTEGQSGILEVKCPYAARNCTILEASTTIKDFCLEKCGENIGLRKKHKHFYQVQGQLLVTGASFCDFVVYTRNDLFIERVMPNKEIMSSMLETLLSFYRDHFRPFKTTQ